jgi:hypothetical protein
MVTETSGDIAIWKHSFVGLEVVLILLTGAIAVSVNVCSFGLIGETNAITYQVVGLAKSILLFIFGLLLFPARPRETPAQFFKKMIALVIAMIGVITYGWFEIKGKQIKNRVKEPELAAQVPLTELPDVPIEEHYR